MSEISVRLPEDPEEAARAYLRLRSCAREAFEGFLRSLNSQSLRWLEQQFEKHGGGLHSDEFLPIFSRVFPKPPFGEYLAPDEHKFVVQLAVLTLFEGVDVDQSGEASWMEFVEFVCAVAEELRLKAQELSGQSFEFGASNITVPLRPAVTKCHFDRIFYWPQHPMDSVVVFEEGQAGFFLHRPGTLARKRRVDGHRSELLAAAFLPAPFEWVVTTGNDKSVCFWDSAFNLVKRWNLNYVVGALCWLPELKVLYVADHFTERIQAWRIPDTMSVRASVSAVKPEKTLEFKEGHTKPVQAMIWLQPLQLLATASLDTTVQLFDLVQLKRNHVLTGHTKGLTCLEYCPKNHMLLSSGFDNFIAIWDPSAGTLSHKLLGHECSIAGLCAVPDTTYEFMSVDFDGVVRLWDVRRLTCTQNFNATDRQRERSGELEPLETRTLCLISRDRVVVSGRRMVVFDRDAREPRVTADWPINALAFHHGHIEIITPIRNDLYLWCALTGKLLTIHDNVAEGNITAITLDVGERRLFVGTDAGEINCVNYACGAQLKSLTPHAYEVSQITCVPGKVLTLSTPEKLINVHDDTDPKASLLKRIDVSAAGALTKFAYDGREMIVGASEEGDVLWYNVDFAKQVSSSVRCKVKHEQAVSTCKYFEAAPLIVTADAEGTAIFWSLPPLRTFEFFSRVLLALGGDGSTAIAVTAMCISWPDEDHMFVATERGGLACVNISVIVENAKRQQEEILHRKASGEAAEVISGRIFDTMPKPCDSPEYVFPLPSDWLVERAHRAGIEDVVFCRRHPAVILTLGQDICVRMWSETGEALGTLEQGMPEGVHFERGSPWRFPLDAHEQVALDCAALEEASKPQEDGDGEDADSPARPELSLAVGTVASERKVAVAAEGGFSPTSAAPREDVALPRCLMAARSEPNLRPDKSRQSARSQTPDAVTDFDYKAIPSRYLQIQKKKETTAEDWLSGVQAMRQGGRIGVLPQLCSGLVRPQQAQEVLQAARKLTSALGVARNSKDRL